MRGLFRIALVAGAAASMYTGYRAVSSRSGRNPAGIKDALLSSEERRSAAARFKWPGRKHTSETTEDAALEADRITE